MDGCLQLCSANSSTCVMWENWQQLWDQRFVAASLRLWNSRLAGPRQTDIDNESLSNC